MSVRTQQQSPPATMSEEQQLAWAMRESMGAGGNGAARQSQQASSALPSSGMSEEEQLAWAMRESTGGAGLHRSSRCGTTCSANEDVTPTVVRAPQQRSSDGAAERPTVQCAGVSFVPGTSRSSRACASLFGFVTRANFCC